MYQRTWSDGRIKLSALLGISKKKKKKKKKKRRERRRRQV
jgi:hypothetical protein